MEGSKLIDLIKTFSIKELREFKEYVASPFFNKNEELILFYAYLRKCAPEFRAKRIAKEKVYKALFPKKKYDEKHISYLMSFLLKLAEQYIGFAQYKKYEIREQYNIMSSCLDRNLQKHFNYILKKAVAKQKKNNQLDENYYYHNYLISDISYKHFLMQNIRKYDTRLQDASDNFDIYYLLHKLKYCCEMINRKKSLNAEYEIHMMEEVLTFLEKVGYIETPHLAIYYRILKSLNESENSIHFEELKALLENNSTKIPAQELKEMFVYAINYAIRKVNIGQAEFMEQLFELYGTAISSGVLFENGFLSPWAYKNQVGVGLRLRKFEEVEQFIHDYSDKLRPESRDNAFNYNMAELCYYRQDFDKAFDYLNAVGFSDVYYSLDTRKMMMKMYYEMEELDALYSLINSFKTFLRRNTLISKTSQQIYMNFIDAVAKLLKYEKEKLAVIKEEVKTSKMIADRTWLLKMFDKKLS